jgi:two-component system alkaline phosphatase synthesis response regulator PhoP
MLLSSNAVSGGIDRPSVLHIEEGEEMALKILVVDDEVHLAKILQFTLERAGYEVVLAYDGEEALELVKRERPALVILDLMLPVLDGYKVCGKLKGDDRTKSIPVIILSARDLSREPIEEPITANLFIEKPFNSENLLERISDLLA